MYVQFTVPEPGLEKSEKELQALDCLEGINEEFSGTIKRVERYESSDFLHKNFFALEIQTTDTTNQFKTYQFSLRYDRDVLDFAVADQTIEKHRGQNSFVLRTSKGQQKTFTIPDCSFIDL
jgi:hypothetical protein